jgi:hypothetical protein
MHASKHRHVASSKPGRYGPGCAVRAKRTIFLILTFSKLILKLTPAKYYLHPVTPLAAPGGVAWQASFAVPHAEARQGCHASQAWHEGQTWARACRATCSSTAALPRHPAWRGSVETTGPARPPFFFLLPFFSPSLEAAPPLTVAPPIPAQIGGFGVGKVGEIVPRLLVKVFPYFSPSFTVALCRSEDMFVT